MQKILALLNESNIHTEIFKGLLFWRGPGLEGNITCTNIMKHARTSPKIVHNIVLPTKKKRRKGKTDKPRSKSSNKILPALMRICVTYLVLYTVLPSLCACSLHRSPAVTA
jgi:hypothetical protein